MSAIGSKRRHSHSDLDDPKWHAIVNEFKVRQELLLGVHPVAKLFNLQNQAVQQ